MGDGPPDADDGGADAAPGAVGGDAADRAATGDGDAEYDADGDADEGRYDDPHAPRLFEDEQR